MSAMTHRVAASVAAHGWRRARELDLFTQTLALGAQQVLCTAPLLVAVSAVVQRASGDNVGRLLTRYLGLRGSAANDVTALFANSTPVSTTGLLVGLILVVVFSTGVAATQQRGYELISSQPRAGLRSTGRQLRWILTLLGYVMALLYGGRFGHRVGGFLHVSVVARALTQFAVSSVFYWWSRHLLLAGRVGWRRLAPGAMCIGVGTAALMVSFGWVLPGQITDQVANYGPVGATFVLAIWLVVLSGVIFGGALLGAVIVERRS